jgi:hypothetical protein
MRWADAWIERGRRVPPLVPLIALAVLQLVVLAGLAHGQGWSYSTGDAVLGALLVTADLVLVCAVAFTIGGRLMGLLAGIAWVLAPAVLTRYFVAGGSPLVDFGTVFRQEVLPYAYGFAAPGAVVAGGLLLVSAWIALAPQARSLAGELGSGAAAGAAIGAAALFHPLLWPAVLAPALALVFARRLRAALAAAAVAVLLGLAALALFRYVPGIHPGWSTIGHNIDQFREFSWSRRVLEYLPLAGFVGLALRHRPAAAFFGWLLLTAIVFPLGRELTLTELMLALVPGYASYAVLAASVVLLVPSRRRSEAAATWPSATAASSDPRS